MICLFLAFAHHFNVLYSTFSKLKLHTQICDAWNNTFEQMQNKQACMWCALEGTRHLRLRFGVSKLVSAVWHTVQCIWHSKHIQVASSHTAYIRAQHATDAHCYIHQFVGTTQPISVLHSQSMMSSYTNRNATMWRDRVFLAKMSHM